MENNKPAIALRRQAEAKCKFNAKLAKLEELITAQEFDKIPLEMRATTFMAWEDKELNIEKISRNLLYKSEDEYKLLYIKLEKLLTSLSKHRGSGLKKEEKLSELNAKLNAAERRAATYLNDYSVIKAQLDDKIHEIARLEERLARLTAKSKNVQPLRAAKRRPDNEA
jgi:chromosome segregation ATPase